MAQFKKTPITADKTVERSLQVRQFHRGMRLDVLISRFCNDFSRTEIQELIRKGAITVDGQTKRSSFRINGNELITLSLPQKIPFHHVPSRSDIHLPVLYEDQWLVVVNKPAGMAVHPACGHVDDTVMNVLARSYGHLSSVPCPVHRLDRDVSGVLLCGIGRESSRALCLMFSQRCVRKTYLAIVEGHPQPEQGTMTQPISQPRRSTINRAEAPLKPASTTYRVYLHFFCHSLVLLMPKTGRHHQLRQHTMYSGHPIVGDTRYGTASELIARPALHALQLSFLHPFTHRKLSVFAPLAEDMRKLLADLLSLPRQSFPT